MQNPYSGLAGSKVVVVTIDRKTIESPQIKTTLASLAQLVDSLETLVASNGSLSL